MTIKTIRRAKWHRKSDRWQVRNKDGTVYAIDCVRPPEPICRIGVWHDHSWTGTWHGGKLQFKPTDYRATLRRIRPAKKGNK